VAAGVVHSTGEITAEAGVTEVTEEVVAGVGQGVGEAGAGVAEESCCKDGKAATRTAREDGHEVFGHASSVRMRPEVKNGALAAPRLRFPSARMVVAGHLRRMSPRR